MLDYYHCSRIIGDRVKLGDIEDYTPDQVTLQYKEHFTRLRIMQCAPTRNSESLLVQPLL